MKSIKTTIVLLFACLVLVACGVLSPQQKAGIRATLNNELVSGNITNAQYDAAIEAMDNDKPIDWETLGFVGANILLALIGGPAIVRLQRGLPTQKVGLPADKIIQ